MYWQRTSTAIPAFSVQASNASVIRAFSAGYDNADVGGYDGDYAYPSQLAVLNQNVSGLAYYTSQPL